MCAINDELGKQLERAFEQQVRASQQAGEVDTDLSPREVARSSSTTLCGMKVGAEGGTTPAQLTSTAKLALRSLAPHR